MTGRIDLSERARAPSRVPASTAARADRARVRRRRAAAAWKPRPAALGLGLGLTLAACGGGSSGKGAGAAPGTGASGAGPASAATSATELVVRALPRPALLEAAGVAEPYARATLSTRLMGSVTRVWVREGDRVRAGQPLVSIDARELEAKTAQVEATLAEAEAVHREAAAYAARIRALYADSAAPRAQLDGAEAGLARAEAAVAAARAGGAELSAMNAYAVVRAPFDGTVTSRMVDEGAFAAPGTPLLTLQDGSRLRVSASAAPDAVRGIRRGDTLRAAIEDAPVVAVVEGVVPAPAGSLYTVNAIVRDDDGRFLPGSAATLSLPQGMRPTLLVPAVALVRQGDLVGVRVRSGRGSGLRWVRTADAAGDSVEVVAGLRDGERIELPAGAARSRPAEPGIAAREPTSGAERGGERRPARGVAAAASPGARGPRPGGY